MPADIDFIIEANVAINEISGSTALAGLRQRLNADIFSDEPKAYVIIAEMDGRPVGMALYSWTYFANDGRIMWLSQVYVKPEYRRHRVAFALFRELKNAAAAGGAHAIVGGVDSENLRAMKVYNFIGAQALDKYKLMCCKI